MSRNRRAAKQCGTCEKAITSVYVRHAADIRNGHIQLKRRMEAEAAYCLECGVRYCLTIRLDERTKYMDVDNHPCQTCQEALDYLYANLRKLFGESNGHLTVDYNVKTTYAYCNVCNTQLKVTTRNRGY
jgi:hypothetical protein